jgi:DNA-binding LacI/PurR family transcriptional regulator
MAAEVLANEGRRRALVLAGPADSWASGRRTDGFVAAMREHGLPVEVWHNASMSPEAGADCAARLLAIPRAQRPDAVFATNDALALGFTDGLRDSGLRLPDDVSLIGFDNLPSSSWAPYRLTTFEQPLDAMVAGVLGHIQAHRDGGGEPVPETPIYCPPRLILRQTTKAAS